MIAIVANYAVCAMLPCYLSVPSGEQTDPAVHVQTIHMPNIINITPVQSCSDTHYYPHPRSIRKAIDL